jgi:hypothetical protein
MKFFVPMLCTSCGCFLRESDWGPDVSFDQLRCIVLGIEKATSSFCSFPYFSCNDVRCREGRLEDQDCAWSCIIHSLEGVLGQGVSTNQGPRFNVQILALAISVLHYTIPRAK